MNDSQKQTSSSVELTSGKETNPLIHIFPSNSLKPGNSIVNAEEKRKESLAVHKKESWVSMKSDASELSKFNLLETNQELTDKNILLSKKSKFMLILRISVLFLAFVFFPYESVYYETLENFELKYIFKWINNSIEDKIQSHWYVIIEIINRITNVDSFMILSTVFYIIYQPFRSSKISLLVGLSIFFFTFLKLFYKSTRPFWWDNGENVLCKMSYANPSIHMISNTMFIGLILKEIADGMRAESKKELSSTKKLIGYSVFFGLFLFQLIFNIINRDNFIYQSFNALVISLLLTILSIEFDVSIHNYLISTLSSLGSTRECKILVFIMTLMLVAVSIVIFSVFKSDDLVIEIYENIVNAKSCKGQINNLGIKETFLEISVLFMVPGIFSGISITVENEVSRWWNYEALSRSKLIQQVAILVIVGQLYFISLGYLEDYLVNFEASFVLRCSKYYMYFHFGYGYLPSILKYFKIAPEVPSDLDDKEESQKDSEQLSESDVQSLHQVQPKDFKKTIIVKSFEKQDSYFDTGIFSIKEESLSKTQIKQPSFEFNNRRGKQSQIQNEHIEEIEESSNDEDLIQEKDPASFNNSPTKQITDDDSNVKQAPIRKHLESTTKVQSSITKKMKPAINSKID